MNKKAKYTAVWVFLILTVILNLLNPVITPYIAPYIAPYISNKIEKITPVEVKTFLKEYVADIQNKDLDSLVSKTEVGIEIPNIDTLHADFEDIRLDTGKVIGISFSKETITGSSPTLYQIVYQFETTDTKNIYKGVRAQIFETDGQYKLRKIESRASSVAIDLSSTKNSSGQYDVNLFIKIAYYLLITFTAFMYLKNSPNPRWWLLIIILLLTFTFSLTTPEFGQIGLKLPLGVIIYWIWRKKIYQTETRKLQAATTQSV